MYFYLCLLDERLSCYKCMHYDECTADMPGEIVHCQMDDPEGDNYGDSCEVFHSGNKLFTFKL